jgi:hypothetical protein
MNIRQALGESLKTHNSEVFLDITCFVETLFLSDFSRPKLFEDRLWSFEKWDFKQKPRES